MAYPYTSGELVEVIETIKTPSTFFMDTFFPAANTRISNKEEILFDEVMKGLPVLAPFVSPVVQAKPMERSGYFTKAFKPAYVKPKHILKPTDYSNRLPGEPIEGNLSPEERQNRDLLKCLEEQKASITARWEWMAAFAVIDGKVTVKGEDYPAVLVDFGRDAANTIVLSAAGAVWSNPAAPITDNLEDWSLQILEQTGFAATDVIMGPSAWKSFKKNESVLADADRRRGIVEVPVLTPMAPIEGAQYKGKYGEFDIWVYSGSYRDEDGSSKKYLGTNDVLMVSKKGFHGIPAFGAIYDVEAWNGGFADVRIFPKTWIEKDPSAQVAMSQSAPLMIPGRPNAVIKATVQS